METISSKILKARRVHTCDWCGLTINVGAKYENSKMKNDYFYTWENHLHCLAIAKRLKMFDECGDNGLSGDDFHEIIYMEYEKLFPANLDDPFPERLDAILKINGIEKDKGEN